MNRVVHFEFHSPDPEKSLPFFERVFGWDTNRLGTEPYWLCATGEGAAGIDGGIMQSRDGEQRTVCTIDVADVDAAIELVEANGGAVAVPRFAVPGVGWVAFATDPAGVLFGVYAHDESAS